MTEEERTRLRRFRTEIVMLTQREAAQRVGISIPAYQMAESRAIAGIKVRRNPLS